MRSCGPLLLHVVARSAPSAVYKGMQLLTVSRLESKERQSTNPNNLNFFYFLFIFIFQITAEGYAAIWPVHANYANPTESWQSGDELPIRDGTIRNKKVECDDGRTRRGG